MFTGKEHDEKTGLIYFGARFYDPDTARFINQDSYLGQSNTPPSLHRYLYAYSNPLYHTDLDGYESVSSMIDGAADGCQGAGCFGWAFLKTFYRAGTLGFADIHDPARDARDDGRISDNQYYAATGAALVAPAVVIGTGGLAGGAVAATTTTVGRIGVTAAVGAAYGGGLDAYTQGTHMATGVQGNYDAGRTAMAAATGAVLAPFASESAALGAEGVQAVRSVFANRAQPKITIERPNISAQADAEAGVPSLPREVLADTKHSNATGPVRFDDPNIPVVNELPKDWISQRPQSSDQYSVAFEAKLTKEIHYPGETDKLHFQESNRQLHEQMQADTRFAQMLEEMFPGIGDVLKPGPRGAYPRTAPIKGTTWHHHPTEEGVMQLIPLKHHKSGGPVQKTLHPDQKGGMENWGGGR